MLFNVKKINGDLTLNTRLVQHQITNFSIEGLKLLHALGIQWDFHITETTASMGDLSCLIFAHKNGCPWDISTTMYAAETGHLNCLQYALENGCPWNQIVILNAASNEHYECLKYANNFGTQCTPSLRTRSP